jgi:thioredoxin-like negative regulator of GroEL
VVDVGIASGSLADTLRQQVLLARAKDQRMVVMLTGRRCSPCRGIDEALSDPLMQQALSRVRLVRVDLDAFGDELAALDIPTGLYPAFFLLDAELRPVDAIHGGEWDEDVAENIAPVLGAFLRGEYRKRRHDWSPTASSIRL